jgi:hypothetical protein
MPQRILHKKRSDDGDTPAAPINWPLHTDYRDDVIAQFADDEASTPDRLIDVLGERDTYHLIAVQAIHALHNALTRQRELSMRLRRVLDETKLLRAWLRRQRRVSS